MNNEYTKNVRLGAFAALGNLTSFDISYFLMEEILRPLIISLFYLLGVSFVAYAEDVETVYQSVIPKASACFSAKQDSAMAEKCYASCNEALGNLRVLVGLPQPLSEEMQKQVALCEADYTVFSGAVEGVADLDEMTNEGSQANIKNQTQVEEVGASDHGDAYSELKAELSSMETECSNVPPNRMSQLCERFCKQAVIDLDLLVSGDSNMIATLKNSRNDVEKMPSVRQCRLRHRSALG